MSSADSTTTRSNGRPSVLLVAHGATGLRLPGSRLAGLVERLRQRTDLAGADAAYLRGDPALSGVLASDRGAAPLCIVPIFAAEGHHTRGVLRGIVDAARIARPRRVLRQTPALGIVPAYTRLLADHVHRTVRERGLAPSRTAFIAIGHGLKTATLPCDDAARRLAAALRPDFARSEALYLEGQPDAAEWATRLREADVVVAPLFFSDATHARVDVPQLFGQTTPADATHSPWTVDGRRIWPLALPLADDGVAAIIAALARDDGSRTTRSQTGVAA